MEGIIVQAQAAHYDGARGVEWELGQVFMVAPEVVERFPTCLRVLKPEELEVYYARGGVPPRRLEVPGVGTREVHVEAQLAEVEEERRRDLDYPEHDRSMAGKGGVRRRNG